MHMDVRNLKRLRNNPASLKKMLREVNEKAKDLEHKIAQHEQTIKQQDDRIQTLSRESDQRESHIEKLEDQIRLLQQHRFGRRSEKFEDYYDPNLGRRASLDLTLFNEPEVVTDEGEHPTWRGSK